MSSELKVSRSVFEGSHLKPAPRSQKPENDSPKTKATHYIWNDEDGRSSSDLTGLKISPKRRSGTSISSKASSLSSKSSVYDRLYTKPTHSAQVRLQEKMKWEWGPQSPVPAEKDRQRTITISSNAELTHQDRRKSAPYTGPAHSPVRQPQEKRKSAPYTEKENAVFDRLYTQKTESAARHQKKLHKKELSPKVHKDEKAHKTQDSVVRPVFDRLYSQSTQSSSLRTSSQSFKLDDDDHHNHHHGSDSAVNPIFDRLYTTKTEAAAVREHEIHARTEEEHHFNNRKPEVVNPVFDRLYAQKTEAFAVREQEITHSKHEDDLHHSSHHKNSVVTPVFHRLYAQAQDMEMRKAAARARPPSPPPKQKHRRIKVVLRTKPRAIDPDMLDDRKPAAIDMKEKEVDLPDSKPAAIDVKKEEVDLPDTQPAAMDLDQENTLDMPDSQPAVVMDVGDNSPPPHPDNKPDPPAEVDEEEEHDGEESIHRDISDSNPDAVDADVDNGELPSSHTKPKESSADSELKLAKQRVRLSEVDSTQLDQPPLPKLSNKLYLSQPSMQHSMSTEDKGEYYVLPPPRLSPLHSMSTEDKEQFLLQSTALEATISTEDIVNVEPRREGRSQQRPGAYSVDMAGRTVVVTTTNRFDVSVVLENDDTSIEDGVVDPDNSEATLAIHLEAVPVDDNQENSRVRDLEMQMNQEIARRQDLERRMERKDRQIKQGLPIVLIGLLVFAAIIIGMYFGFGR